MKIISALLRATLLMPLAAQAAAPPAPPIDARPDAHTVLTVPRKRVETADYRATGRLVKVDAAGTRTSYAINMKAHWFPGVLRVLVEVASPANARVRILLEMRPGGKNTVQIAHPGEPAPTILPFDRWNEGVLGSGFSFEDFLEAQYFWPGQAALETAKFGARTCDVVRSTPGADDKTHNAEVKMWLDRGIGFPVYVEKTLKATGAVKEFTYFGLRQESGIWSASQVEVKLRGRAGSTLLIVDRGSPKANLGPADFGTAQLTHF
jgi:hypothetical protein